MLDSVDGVLISSYFSCSAGKDWPLKLLFQKEMYGWLSWHLGTTSPDFTNTMAWTASGTLVLLELSLELRKWWNKRLNIHSRKEIPYLIPACFCLSWNFLFLLSLDVLLVSLYFGYIIYLYTHSQSWRKHTWNLAISVPGNLLSGSQNWYSPLMQKANSCEPSYFGNSIPKPVFYVFFTIWNEI